MTTRKMKVQNNLAAEGISILDASSPKFDQELQNFGPPKALNKIAPVLPFALIVKNDTGRYLYSFTVVYTYSTRISPSGKPWRYVASPTALSVNDRRLAIAPGQRYLVTPISDFLVSQDASGRVLQPIAVDEDLERRIAFFEENDSKETIEASIDSLIDENGKLSGPDVGNKLDRVNAGIKAEQDLVSELLNVPLGKLQKKLTELSALNKNRPSGSREYTFRKMVLLDLFTGVVQSKGPEAVHDMLRKRAEMKTFPNSDQVTRE